MMRTVATRKIIGAKAILFLLIGILIGGLGAEVARGAPIPDYLFNAPRVEFRTEARASDKWPKDPAKIYGYLFKPEGKGPFPAVVFLHGCSGFQSTFSTLGRIWAARLVGWGYVVFLADSLEARGVRTLCGPYRLVSPEYGRPRDAYAALRYLQNLPSVKADRIGVMGWSHGGWTVLHTMEKRARALPSPSKERFRAGIAIYPYCGAHVGGISSYAPLLVLIGENDDWTPAQMCESMVVNQAEGGKPVKIKVYPGAYHSFDNRRTTPLDYLGHRLEHNPAAEQDAAKRVKAFLAENLK